MTGKERILTTLEGGRPDRVPFAPNLWQWFHVNKSRGTLPESVRGCASPVGVLRTLGADVMSKFDGIVLEERLHDCRREVAFEWPENLDSLFYSPGLFREFCLRPMRRAAEMIHARGRFMFAHACGRLRALAPLFIEAGLDCVEGQAHPPIGDWRLDEARALSERLIVCGGMTAREQEWSGPDAGPRIEEHVRELFMSLGDRRRFLFASGCNCSPQMPLENLISFRDAAWKHGALSRNRP